MEPMVKEAKKVDLVKIAGAVADATKTQNGRLASLESAPALIWPRSSPELMKVKSITSKDDITARIIREQITKIWGSETVTMLETICQFFSRSPDDEFWETYEGWMVCST